MAVYWKQKMIRGRMHRTWLYTDFTGTDATMEIPPLEINLALADLYDKVKFIEDDEPAADDKPGA
jgi:hypothetical protein